MGFFRHPQTLVILFVSVFSSLWLFFETTAYFLDVEVKGVRRYLALLGISSIVATVYHWFEYRDSCPPGLEEASVRARRLAHLQRLKWEYKLTKTLLAERLGPIDRECLDLLANKVFVCARKIRDVGEYVGWIEDRIANMTRMVKISAELLTQRLPSSMMSTREKIAQPKEILAAVESIERFYRETVEYERSGHAVIPPDGFETLHELQKGWSEPIRDAIRQVFQRVEEICDVDPKSSNELNLVFEYHSPTAYDAFMKESERLRKSMGLDFE